MGTAQQNMSLTFQIQRQSVPRGCPSCAKALVTHARRSLDNSSSVRTLLEPSKHRATHTGGGRRTFCR